MKSNFDKYDLQKIKEARIKLIEVYDYNYGAHGIENKVKRLNTIIEKLAYLLEESGYDKAQDTTVLRPF